MSYYNDSDNDRKTVNSVSSGYESAPDKAPGENGGVPETRMRTDSAVPETRMRTDSAVPETRMRGNGGNAAEAGGEAKYKRLARRIRETLTEGNRIQGRNYSYTVTGVLSDRGGEGIVLLCRDAAGKDVVVKVYYEPINRTDEQSFARQKLRAYMESEEGRRYTLPILDYGTIVIDGEMHDFEVSPYCDKGSLDKSGAFSFDEIVRFVEQINEALHSVHKLGLVHRDISPSNLYRYNGRYVIGDFGLVKEAEEGIADMSRHIVGKQGYMAPDLFIGGGDSVYTDKCDYYSLGVTIASLFEGHFVFEGLMKEAIIASVTQGKMPLRRQDDRRHLLENLICGLCFMAAGNRFGYEDVNKWLKDHNHSIMIGGRSIGADRPPVNPGWNRPYTMLGESYCDAKSLYEGVTKDQAHWREGREHLYMDFFKGFFTPIDPDLGKNANSVSQKYRGKDEDLGLYRFLRYLYPNGAMVWRGYTFADTQKLAEAIQNSQNPANYAEILQKRVVSTWFDGKNVPAETVTLVRTIEDCSVKMPEAAVAWYGNAFSGNRRVNISGRTVKSVPDLINLLLASPKTFYDEYYDLLDDVESGAEIYGFLFSFGYYDYIMQVRSNMSSDDEFGRVSAVFSMLDTLAEKEGGDFGKVRSFFETYGPAGIAKLVYRYACDGEKYYAPLDASGRAALDKVRNTKVDATGPVSDMVRAYAPLMSAIESMCGVLTDNPHIIIAGAYEAHGVIARNLAGCFLYEVFGRRAPLGFETLMETK